MCLKGSKNDGLDEIRELGRMDSGIVRVISLSFCLCIVCSCIGDLFLTGILQGGDLEFHARLMEREG